MIALYLLGMVWRSAKEEPRRPGQRKPAHTTSSDNRPKGSLPVSVTPCWICQPANNLRSKARFLQHAPHQRHRQPDHVAVIAFDVGNPSRRDALDGVGPSLIHL